MKTALPYRLINFTTRLPVSRDLERHLAQHVHQEFLDALHEVSGSEPIDIFFVSQPDLDKYRKSELSTLEQPHRTMTSCLTRDHALTCLGSI